MASTLSLLATIDTPTATIIGSLIAGAFAIGIRWAPKTRTEAAVDQSAARLNDASRWEKLLDGYEKANEVLQADILKLRERVDAAEMKASAAHEALELERDECDRRIGELEARLEQLAPTRLFFRE